MSPELGRTSQWRWPLSGDQKEIFCGAGVGQDVQGLGPRPHTLTEHWLLSRCPQVSSQLGAQGPRPIKEAPRTGGGSAGAGSAGEGAADRPRKGQRAAGTFMLIRSREGLLLSECLLSAGKELRAHPSPLTVCQLAPEARDSQTPFTHSFIHHPKNTLSWTGSCPPA